MLCLQLQGASVEKSILGRTKGPCRAWNLWLAEVNLKGSLRREPCLFPPPPAPSLQGKARGEQPEAARQPSPAGSLRLCRNSCFEGLLCFLVNGGGKAAEVRLPPPFTRLQEQRPS